MGAGCESADPPGPQPPPPKEIAIRRGWERVEKEWVKAGEEMLAFYRNEAMERRMEGALIIHTGPGSPAAHGLSELFAMGVR